MIKLDLDGHGPFVLAIESQTDPDPDKIETWPQLVSHLHAKHHSPVGLLVTTQKTSTAKWARREITVKGLPGFPSTLAVRPTVIAPDNTEKITDLDVACADVPFTAFAAVIHAFSEDYDRIYRTTMEAMGTIDVNVAMVLSEYIEAGIQKSPALTLWKALMSASTKPFVTALQAASEARGEAKALLLVLEGRGITVSDEARARIVGCSDTDVLESWLRNAGSITGIDELFETRRG